MKDTKQIRVTQKAWKQGYDAAVARLTSDALLETITGVVHGAIIAGRLSDIDVSAQLTAATERRIRKILASR